jgi:hypothetical protein
MSVIRVCRLGAIVALLLPIELSAQRLPLPGTGRPRPARPAPLPPQAEPIARNLAYKRMRLSVESYPLISYVRSPLSIDGPVSDWSTFGAGTRADYRITRNVSVTLDVTSSFAGGPATVNTLELGTRLGRERSERTLYSFVDLRVGYVESYSSFDGLGGFAFPTSQGGPVFGFSRGFGGLAGVGAEYALTRRFSLTAQAAMMRNRMTTDDYFSTQPSSSSFTMAVYRVMLGLRYNPVRVIRPLG